MHIRPRELDKLLVSRSWRNARPNSVAGLGAIISAGCLLGDGDGNAAGCFSPLHNVLVANTHCREPHMLANRYRLDRVHCRFTRLFRDRVTPEFA
jgi:hypothetical protein